MNSGDWIEDIQQAHDFKKGIAAIAFVNENNLKNVELVYSFSEPRYNFIIAELGQIWRI